MRRAIAALFGFSLVALASGPPHDAMAQSQEGPATLADSDAIYIDGTNFTITPGKAKRETDVETVVMTSDARELGPGAIVFRSRQRLYIVDAPLRVPGASTDAFVGPEQTRSRPNRIRIEYVPPTNPEHQKIYERLKARQGLEMVQKLYSPFRLPVDITVKLLGCDGQVNAWYEWGKSGPTVSICYEYEENIMRNSPMETTPDGITREDAMVGQCLFVVSHELAHALFEIFSIPVFGREEDAADQMAAYFMLNLGPQRARALIGGAAFAYYAYVKHYQDNPTVAVPLTAFSSDHGSPEERYFNLLCIAYGAYPDLFAAAVDSGMLPKTRARTCGYEFRTLRHAVISQLRPHLDWPLSREVWRPETLAEVSQPAGKD